MKINRLEAHDRLLFLKKDQEANVFKGADDCLNQNRDSLALQEYSPYVYLYAHARTADDGVNKRLLWQPRLTKGQFEPNSYCFRAISHTDQVEVCWILPDKHLWKQYVKGNLVEHELIIWSISQFKTNRERMNQPEPDDLSDEKIEMIYRQIANNSNKNKMMDKLYKD